MTVNDVIRLSQAGVSEDIIIQQIRSKARAFNLTTDDLIRLKTASVSETIIRVMLRSSASPAAAAPAASAVTPTAPTPAVASVATTGSRASTVEWTTHRDPAGFSVNVPAGWTVVTDQKQGQVTVNGVRGERVVVWPGFIEQRQLDAAGANALVLQLARKLDDRLPWATASPAGNMVRVVARGEQRNGATFMTWSNVSGGASVCVFSVEAPTALYRSSSDTFEGILRSFHVARDASAKGVAAVGTLPLNFVTFTDPREHAFTMAVPRGWQVVGGAYRLTPTDIRNAVTMISPDGGLRVFFGDAHIGAFTEPNRMMGRVGMREGSYETISDGSKIQVHHYLTGEQFARAYIEKFVKPQCSNLQVESSRARQDLASEFLQKARTEDVTGAHMTAGEVTFTCDLHGSSVRGYVVAGTAGKSSGPVSIWFPYRLYGYLAAPGNEEVAGKVTQQMVQSWQLDRSWLAHEAQLANNEVQQDRARSQQIQAQAQAAIQKDQQETSDMIVKGYEARSRVEDETFRRTDNAILGQMDVVDPNTGTQYKVDNYSNYHWMNDSGGTILGTEGPSNPGSGWHEMVALP
jgi:hypothetical protein